MTVNYVTFSNLIIDDIVFPDGQTFMNTLGGAGMHALVGMRIWSDRLGYAAAAGPDLDAAHRESLEQFGVDLNGLVQRDGFQTARAWQVFELDERRIEVFRTSMDDFERYQVTKEDLPETYYGARGFHIQWGTLVELADLIAHLRARNPALKIVVEPTYEQLEKDADGFISLMSHVSLFSPDMGEGELITGQSTPEEICDTLLGWGAPLVAIRMGEQGSLIRTPDGEGWLIPAVPASIVDVTGAGNAYCGGFLTGLGDGVSLLEAAMRATVSASFALEQFGLPGWQETPEEEANRRLNWVRKRVEPVDF
jgi:sugar/nucleoside kinase (ribokinase family)